MPPRRPGERQGVRGELKSRRTKLAGLFLATMAIWLTGSAVAQAGQPDDRARRGPRRRHAVPVPGQRPNSFGGILLQDNGNPADGINNQHTVRVQAGIYSIKLRDRDDGDWVQRSAVCSDGSPVGSRGDRRDRERDLHVHL